TLGSGGHTEAILESSEQTRVIGFDRDPAAIEIATKRLSGYGERFEPVNANFSSLKEELETRGIASIEGLVADLGVSSMQLDSKERGFSFRFDAPLDMRMNPDSDDETAADLLERLSEKDIADLIYKYGEERRSRRIARRIVAAREKGKPVETTTQLANLVRGAVPRKRNEKVHPATKTFQALRIAVNSELEILEGFLRDAVGLLRPDGRMVVISFHSLEDRIVKRTFQNLAGRCFCPRGFPECVCGSSKMVEIITRKPVTPSEPEQQSNQRSRSAKLRALRKLA
ncbi:MAG: 16S rRNA (cytosine(1402)-N(4))-methyltransferase RsmH, partial [Pyrinomonadaceae bacterium]|nr:16S rRNA (cytosine(1402)-N(4))-methyltransferase RsmH [Pyrinomonadaceae bacterium]